MLHPALRVSSLLLLVLLGDTFRPAIATAQTRTVAGPRRVVAMRAATPPTIDGSLDEAVWQNVEPVGDFTQSDPREGQPASEKTLVRVLFDNQALYVGVICLDSDPASLVMTDARRDTSLDGQDSFQMILDTYHDRQNGFIFGTTPNGQQFDAQVRNQGETLRGGPPTGVGGNAGGAGEGVNTNWDGSWTVRTQVTATGWNAEFAIPLRTLRYGSAPQTWGVNFQRQIVRHRESTFWSPIARIFSLTRVSSAGDLGGLELPSPRDVKLMPYGIMSANRNFASASQDNYDQLGDWGTDAKIGVTSSTTLDLTYNTDFAQVEVDEQQINLTRFNLLFPEKRPFFLENRGIFAVGMPGQIDLFFSRAIGISNDGRGTLLPIVGGARLTGKAAGFNIGLMNMQTEQTGTVAGNNFSAARISKNLPNRSEWGAIAVSRVGTGSLAGDDNWNGTFGMDGRWGIKNATTLSGFAARTKSPGEKEGEYAFSGALDYRTRTYETQASYAQVGRDFDPQVGFLRRPDPYKQLNLTLRRHIRNNGLRGLGLREFEPHASYESFWGLDGFQETATLHVDGRWDFENGNAIGSAALNVQYEGLRVPFEVYPGIVVPAGQYRSPYFLLNSNTDRRKWLSASLNANVGGFLSGSQVSLSPAINIRKEGVVTSTLRWTINDIDLPQGSFKTNLVSGRVTYNLTPMFNVSTLVQVNDLTDRWSMNLRLTWLRTAATGLFVVFNDTEGFNASPSGAYRGYGPVNRSFVIKYSHQIDVLDYLGGGER